MTSGGRARVERLNPSRVIGEFVVIVLGVLVALAADRWAQGLDDARAGAEYLLRLEEDLVTDSTALAEASEASRAAAVAMQALWALEAARSTLDTDSLRALAFGGLTPGDEPSAAAATFEELKASGHLQLISQPALRREVLGYYQVASEYRTRLLTARGRGREPYAEAMWDTGSLIPGERPGDAWVARFLATPDLDRLVGRAASYHQIRINLLSGWQERVTGALNAVREAGR